jgi:hypothetical protein
MLKRALLIATSAVAISYAGDTVEIGAGRVVLKFASDGRPKSFKADDKELLNEQDPGPGFELNGFAFNYGRPTSFAFKDLRWDGKQLVASIKENLRITFDVKATDRYITFKVSRVEGVPKSNLLWLKFKMNMDYKAKTLPLDYMTQAAHWGCEVSWPWLWERSAHTPLGGFALYVPSDDADADETLLHIWANEGLPHPKVKGEWTVEAARTWLGDWQRQFSDQSQMLITATNNAELYQLADFAAKLDIKRIYMHTDTWRGEYWPVKYSFLHLNPATFPTGEEDFQKFAKYARKKGIGLTIHTVSCAIANEDPDYVAGKMDPRLARWIDGTLAQPVSATDTMIAFRPASGAELPTSIDRPVTGPANVDPWNNIRTMRLGGEFIAVGEFADTDKDVWLLKACRRGLFKTTAVPHPANTGVTGLIRPYDQCFTADNDSTLVAELGRRMAEFCNRNNIIHCEQDAGEIHTVNHQWGYAKFTEAVYTNLDHAATSNNSGGSHMPCQLEYRFNSSKTAIAARNQPQVPLTLARNGRLSTGPYEMFSAVAKPVAAGVRSIGLYKPEPMFGVSTEILLNHGLSSYAAATVLAWKRVAILLTEQQRKTILGSGDEVIYRAEKKGAGHEITPLRMLARPGIDIGWKTGSEFGPIVPRQYVKTGESLAVENPYAEQEPEFVIRVMAGFDGQTRVSGKISESASADKAIVAAYNVGAGLKPAEATTPKETAAALATLLQPKTDKIRNVGDHQFAAEGDALKIRFENKRNEEVKNEENLPFFDCASNMEKARGIGLTVTGDGSGAVLVLQAHCHGARDYIVVVDFKGPREIVIPSGEVSWADARWGWRFATKGSKYGTLRRMSIGLGKVPPKTTVDIKVSKIRLLPEVPTALINPVIMIGAGTMQLSGTVPSDSYVWYTGGDTIGVYDLNWKKRADLPVKKKAFIAPRGPLQIRVESPGSNPMPWLECQFFVKGSVCVSPARIGEHSGGSEAGAVAGGRDAVEFLEKATEIKLVREAEALGDLLDLQLRPDHQLQRLLVESAVEILLGREARAGGEGHGKGV